jgi:CRISPR-associated protein Cas1
MLSKPDFKEKNIIIVYADNEERVSIKNDNLIIKDEQGIVKLQKTCYRIFTVWIFGKCIITSGIMEKAKKFGFSIYVFSWGTKPLYQFLSKTEGNVLLRRKQYLYNSNEIANLLVSNKIENQIRLLKSLRKKDEFLRIAIKNLEVIQESLVDAENVQSLMGKEGSASKIFFIEWYGENWKKRQPRAKTDIYNVLLDIGYTQLFNYVDAFLNLYGFDTYCGVYHKFFYQRKSLVCDIVEPFRCIIDLQLRNSFNLNQIDESHFNIVKGKYVLDFKFSKHYTALFLGALVARKEEIFDYVQNYYRSFVNDRNIETYPFFYIK